MRSQAEAAAEAGLVRLMLSLQHEELSWPVNSQPFAWQFGDFSVSIAIENEGAKLSLNRGASALMAAFLQDFGVEPNNAIALVGAIDEIRLGYRVPISDPTFNVMGNVTGNGTGDVTGNTEDNQSNVQAGSFLEPETESPARPPGVMMSVHALKQLPGIDVELFTRIAPFLTVHSNHEWPDPIMMDEPVTRAMQAVTGNAGGSMAEAGSELQLQMSGFSQNAAELMLSDLPGLLASPAVLRVELVVTQKDFYRTRAVAFLAMTEQSMRLIEWRPHQPVDGPEQ